MLHLALRGGGEWVAGFSISSFVLFGLVFKCRRPGFEFGAGLASRPCVCMAISALCRPFKPVKAWGPFPGDFKGGLWVSDA